MIPKIRIPSVTRVNVTQSKTISRHHFHQTVVKKGRLYTVGSSGFGAIPSFDRKDFKIDEPDVPQAKEVGEGKMPSDSIRIDSTQQSAKKTSIDSRTETPKKEVTKEDQEAVRSGYKSFTETTKQQ